MNLKLNDTTSTSLLVTWNKVPAADKNGVILSYTVRFQAIGVISVNAPGNFKLKIAFPTRKAYLTGLIKNQRYNISVLAPIIKGDGPNSPPIYATTHQDSKSAIPRKYYYNKIQ